MNAKKIREINYSHIQSICAVPCDSMRITRRVRPVAIVLVKSRPQGWGIVALVRSLLKTLGA